MAAPLSAGPASSPLRPSRISQLGMVEDSDDDEDRVHRRYGPDVSAMRQDLSAEQAQDKKTLDGYNRAAYEDFISADEDGYHTGPFCAAFWRSPFQETADYLRHLTYERWLVLMGMNEEQPEHGEDSHDDEGQDQDVGDNGESRLNCSAALTVLHCCRFASRLTITTAIVAEKR